MNYNEESIKKKDFNSLRAKYKSISPNDLQSIIPVWAIENNINKIMDPSLHPQFGNYKIYFVPVKELLDKVDFLELNPQTLFSGDDASDSRIASIIDHWSNGRFMDPPIVVISGNGELRISDGRHRAIVAYHIGEKLIPIAIHETLVEDIKKEIKIFDKKPNL